MYAADIEENRLHGSKRRKNKPCGVLHNTTTPPERSLTATRTFQSSVETHMLNHTAPCINHTKDIVKISDIDRRTLTP